MTAVFSTLSILGLSSIADTTKGQSSNDLCAIGCDFNAAMNGKFTYMGQDPNNDNRAYWYQECNDIAIEWGVGYYGDEWATYVLKSKTSTALYGYCRYLNTFPQSCGEWHITNSDGLSSEITAQYTAKFCSHYQVCISIILNSKYVSSTI